MLENVVNKITYIILSQAHNKPKTVLAHWSSKLHTTCKCHSITSQLERAKNITTDFNKELKKNVYINIWKLIKAYFTHFFL